MNGGKPVALKFFQDEAQVLQMMLLLLQPICLFFPYSHIPLQFAREVEARSWLSSTLVYATTGADTCVVPLLAHYSVTSDEAFATALLQQPQLMKYGHCIVMPAADRSLLEVTICGFGLFRCLLMILSLSSSFS